MTIPETPALSDARSVERRALEWLLSGDTGLSSKALCRHMLGMPPCERWGVDHPHDPADLGRCLRLLERIPEWKARVGEMAAHNKYWAGLVERWDEVAQSMADEVGIDWNKGRTASDTFDLMQSILYPVEKADANVTRISGSVTIAIKDPTP